MSARTPRRTLVAVATASALVGSAIALGTATASAGGPDPTVNVTRIDLGGATDALMLAPDGAGKVWFTLPGTQTYGYVSAGSVSTFTNEGSNKTNTGIIGVLGSTPYLWVAYSNFPFVSEIFAVGTNDIETRIPPWSAAREMMDIVAANSVLWTAGGNAAEGLIYGTSPNCAAQPGSSLCRTQSTAGRSGITVDGSGELWTADADSPDLRRMTPAEAPFIAETNFSVSSRVDKLAAVGTTLYGSVPGQSVLRRIVPGTAPNVTETDQTTSGVVGDVEADDDGNVWFSIAGQPKLGVRTAAGSIYEFDIHAPARRLAYDASTDRLWWSETGTAKVAHMAANTADVTPTSTTTTTTTTTSTTTTSTTTTSTTTTTTAPPTSTATTAPPATTTTTVPPADTTAPTAALTGTTLRLDRNGTIRPVFGPASEPMAVIAQLRIGGVPVTLGGTLMPSGDTRPIALTLPRRHWPRTGRSLTATLVTATIDNARNIGLAATPVTIRR